MPNMPLITRKTPSRCSRMIDQMHNENFRAHMSEEEKIAAEKSLEEYWKPGELYIILGKRAIKNPLFLQRSLKYQTEVKHQKRIKMTMILSSRIDVAGADVLNQNPLYIMLARLVSSKPTGEYTTVVYKFRRVCLLTGFGGDSQRHANVILPRMDKLALEAKSGSLAILIISFVGAQNYQFDIDSSKNHSGPCLWSKLPLESLYSSWQKFLIMDWGQKANSVSRVEMQPCFLKIDSVSGEKCVVIQVPSNIRTSSSLQQVQVTISAQEVGATENPPYGSSFSFHGIPSSLVVFPIDRLRKGQIAFNYRYYNNKLHKTEVTEDFTCPFCSVKCSSFKGLECHLSTHDRFNFEFWVAERYPAIDVSLKSGTMFTEINEGDPNARLEPCPLCSKKSNRRKQKTPVRISGQGPLTDEDDSVKIEKSQTPPGGAESSSQTVPPGNVSLKSDTVITEFSQIEINDDPNARPGPCPLSSKRSRRRKQKTPLKNPRPGPLKTYGEDFVKSEKSQIPPGGAESSVPPEMSPEELQVKHMWTSFEKEHRVCADGRVPWGIEEFSKLHGPLMVRNPGMLWCWKKYIWTQWILGLLDKPTLNNCMVLFEQLAN